MDQNYVDDSEEIFEELGEHASPAKKKMGWTTVALCIVSLFVLMFLISGCSVSRTEMISGDVVKEAPVTSEKSSVASQPSGGDIEIAGSDTLLQLVSNMAEAYKESSPSVRISVTGGGSGAGIASLLNGEIPIADASRKIKQSELDLAVQKGLDVQEYIVARDMLSVIINNDNPVIRLTMGQIADVYTGKITNWKELGGKDLPIILYGRQSTSGTYAFFMEHVLKADYSPKMMNLEGNQAILEAVKQDKAGIGYVGIGYLREEDGNPVSDVKVLRVAIDDNSEYITPLDESKLEEYPVSRELFQYFAVPPLKGSALHRFLLFELSDEGQAIVEKSGFIRMLPGDREHNDGLLKNIR